jgi:hypothetical protein
LVQIFVTHRIWQIANVQFIAHEWDSYQSQLKSDGVPEQTHTCKKLTDHQLHLQK